MIGFNAREGLTIHHLRYVDGGRERSILYRGPLTEMVVPYGDPRPTQARKNAFDVGEYGMGMFANGLQLLRLPGRHHLSGRFLRQPRPRADYPERHLHPRRRLRRALEAHRPATAGRARGAAVQAASGVGLTKDQQSAKI